MKYFKKIDGDRIYLSPINSEDYSKYVEWLNSFEIAKGLDALRKVTTLDNEKEWLEEATNGKYQFAIVKKDEDKLLGNISLINIHDVDRTAEIGIFIGDEENLSHGYGSEAIMLLLDYAFNYLNLNNIMLRVFDFNERAINCYKKIGFKEYGRRSECYYLDGKFYDEILMEYLKKDFVKKV